MKVSVVLSAYNAEMYIKEAIESIIGQTFKDYELIIINDGSKDNTLNIIESIKDSRIQIINQDNQGLISSLNTGLKIAKGEYIVRMDADDIALPNRIEKQVEFMDQNPDVVISGTKIEFFGLKTKRFPYRAFADDENCKKWLVRLPCFAHPSVIIRRDILVKNNLFYNHAYKNAEDYKLWIDLSRFGKFANLQEVLLKYRLSENQITNQKNGLKDDATKRCRREYISQNYPEVNFNNLSIADLRRSKNNKFLKALIYLCLPKNYKVIMYYIFSFDCLFFDKLTSLAIFKSILKNEQRDYI